MKNKWLFIIVGFMATHTHAQNPSVQQLLYGHWLCLSEQPYPQTHIRLVVHQDGTLNTQTHIKPHAHSPFSPFAQYRRGTWHVKNNIWASQETLFSLRAADIPIKQTRSASSEPTIKHRRIIETLTPTTWVWTNTSKQRFHCTRLENTQ